MRRDKSIIKRAEKIVKTYICKVRPLTDEEKERFKQLHPDCLVDFQPSHAATVDGWRKHIRYRHYIWCFKNHQWVPFDQEIPGVK